MTLIDFANAFLFLHKSLLLSRIIAQSVQWSVPFLVIEASPFAVINVKVKQHGSDLGGFQNDFTFSGVGTT